jgi:hypothetical protein
VVKEDYMKRRLYCIGRRKQYSVGNERKCFAKACSIPQNTIERVILYYISASIDVILIMKPM